MNDPNDPLSPNTGDSQKRLLLALALSFVATTVYMFFFAPKPDPQAGAGDAGVVAAGPADAGTPQAAQAPAAPGAAPGTEAAPGAPGAQAAAEPPPPARTVERRRESAVYTFSSDGAGLASAELQGPKMREQQNLTVGQGYQKLFGKDIPPPPQMNLAMPVPGQPLPLAVGIEGPVPFPASTRFAVAEAPAEDGSVVFTGRQGPWEIRKTVRWPREGFELAYTLEVRNTSAQAASGELQIHYGRAIDPNFEEAPSWLGGVGNQSRATCRVGEELHKLVPGDDPPEEDKGAVHFFGIDQQYFLSALYPLEGAREGRCVLTATPTERRVTAGFPLTVNAGETVTMRFGGYLGPKDSDFLRPLPTPALLQVAGATTSFHPALEETVDFGIWAVICKLLLAILKFFHGVTGNWGIAIVLLTVVVKLALLPLTHRSMVSMEAVKKLQPKMEELRKKYADDKERQNLELMKLYQEAKVNPFGGCLPILIQMPVWIALFTALRNSYDIYWEPFFGPVWRDLTYKDPTYILPVLLGVSMVIMQKMQPQMTMDAAQARMMTWVLPIVFTFTLLQYPAGLALYIFTNNVLSVAQQYGLRKWIEKRGGGGGGTPAVAVVTAGGKRK